MATDISALVANYRDAARSLWNTHFLRMGARRTGLEDMNEWDFETSSRIYASNFSPH